MREREVVVESKRGEGREGGGGKCESKPRIAITGLQLVCRKCPAPLTDRQPHKRYPPDSACGSIGRTVKLFLAS